MLQKDLEHGAFIRVTFEDHGTVPLIELTHPRLGNQFRKPLNDMMMRQIGAIMRATHSNVRRELEQHAGGVRLSEVAKHLGESPEQKRASPAYIDDVDGYRYEVEGEPLV